VKERPLPNSSFYAIFNQLRDDGQKTRQNMSQCIKQNKSYFLKFCYLEHTINLIIFTYITTPYDDVFMKIRRHTFSFEKFSMHGQSATFTSCTIWNSRLLLTKHGFPQQVLAAPSIKFHCNLSSGSCSDTCRHTDGHRHEEANKHYSQCMQMCLKSNIPINLKNKKKTAQIITPFSRP
jgi:hypothetical protein